MDLVSKGSSLFVADEETGEPKFWVKTEPKVYLVGSTALEWGFANDDGPPGLYQFFEDEGLPIIDHETMQLAGDKGTLVEIAGRLCYWSFKNPRPGGHSAYMKNIIESGHGSVLEHATFNLIITGVSRTFSHELVRHRLASYSQLSQRYFNEAGCAFICPPKTFEHKGCFGRWLEAMEVCYDAYLNQVADLEKSSLFNRIPDKRDRRKAILGESRSVLPNATETKLVFTTNTRSIRGVIDQRGDPAADQEIRRVALKMFDLVYGNSPSLFSDYKREELQGYGGVVKTDFRKV